MKIDESALEAVAVKTSAVRKNPQNGYHNFVNLHGYLHGLRVASAVSNAQQTWTGAASKESRCQMLITLVEDAKKKKTLHHNIIVGTAIHMHTGVHFEGGVSERVHFVCLHYGRQLWTACKCKLIYRDRIRQPRANGEMSHPVTNSA